MQTALVSLDRQRPSPRGFFGVVRRAQTYRNLLYLALAFPIAMAYSAAFTPLFANGIGYGDLWAFLTFVLLLSVGTWVLAFVERWLAQQLLRVELTPRGPALPRDATLGQRLQAYLSNPVTWKSLAYLTLRVPFGFAVAGLGSVLLTLIICTLFAPAIYAVAVVYVPSRDPLVAWIGTNGQFTTNDVAVSVGLSVLGVFILLGALHTLNGVARGWGWFAQQMLGMNPKDAQLAEARAAAEASRARAAESERMRRQLVLDASHELRTPVATIRAHLESLLLLEGEHLPENVRSYLGVTAREAERLGGLVDDLLMLARADSDELVLDIQPVDVGAVVEEAFQAMEPLAERDRQITLVREVVPGLPPAYADRARLMQVLLNLVRNAITYTPNGGLVSITLALGTEPETLALTVTDTGIGIPEAELDHVFERFYRTDASRARHTGGFGLGLSIARDLVQAMGGTIGAERVPSGGSRFRVTLRAASAPQS